jgi:hypothetical protein
MGTIFVSFHAYTTARNALPRRKEGILRCAFSVTTGNEAHACTTRVAAILNILIFQVEIWRRKLENPVAYMLG